MTQASAPTTPSQSTPTLGGREAAPLCVATLLMARTMILHPYMGKPLSHGTATLTSKEWWRATYGSTSPPSDGIKLHREAWIGEEKSAASRNATSVDTLEVANMAKEWQSMEDTCYLQLTI